MFKTSSKKVLLSLLVSSLMMPVFASSPLESYIDQTIHRQNAPSDKASTATNASALIQMDHYDRHAALTEMLETIEAGALKNNPQDLFLLGYYYYSEAEDNSQQDVFHKAKDYFLQAEKGGSKEASYLLGELYYYGEGVEQDYQTALQYYKKAADRKQKDALFSLGSLYMTGLGGDTNPQKAVEYFEQAALLGDNSSRNTLGYIYESGAIDEINIDLDAAKKWYQQACDNEDSQGCDSLNRLKINSLSFNELLTEITEQHAEKKSTNKALPLLAVFLEDEDNLALLLNEYLPEIIQEAQLDNPDAIFLLGRYYDIQADVNYDAYAYAQAKILYEKAIELGSSDAIYSLAELYYYGNGVEQNYEKSLALYLNPKLDNHPEALFSRAVQYDSGEGVKQNYETSFNLFKKASDLGHLGSTFNVGYMYEYGEFVDVDYQEAEKWYQQACDYGDNSGCQAVEYLQEKINPTSSSDSGLESLFNEIMGNETSKAPLELTTASILSADNHAAREFLKSHTEELLQSIKTNNDANSLFLTGYLFYLEGLDNDHSPTYSQSYALMEKAAEQGSLDATFYLALMNFHGNGVEQNYQAARELLETLRDNDDQVQALFYLATIYDEGLGTEVNQEKSFELYQKAAQLGHPDSAYNVGFMYQHGEFVSEDLIAAQQWYEKSCELGDLDGCEVSERLQRTLDPNAAATAEVFADEAIIDEEAPEKARNPIEGSIKEIFDGVLDIF